MSPPLCISVAKIFDWGAPNQKSHAMTSSKIFEKGTFCGTKIVEWKIRSCGVVWHLTKNFLMGGRLNQKLKMKISKLEDLCK